MVWEILIVVWLISQQWVAVPADKLAELHDLANAYDVIGKINLFPLIEVQY